MPQRLDRLGLLLPQQTARRTPQRQDQIGRPLPQQLATLTPQRRTKTHTPENLGPSERSGLANSYTVATANHLTRHDARNQEARPTRGF